VRAQSVDARSFAHAIDVVVYACCAVDLLDASCQQAIQGAAGLMEEKLKRL
jgi:hypothetical protein